MEAGRMAPASNPAAMNMAAAAAAPARPVERLSSEVHHQLNLASLKTRAIGLHRAISRILEEFDACARANQDPKWQDAVGQFSMVSMELFNIVDDVMKASTAFVVFPRNVNAETSTILPVMLSSKLLPEMEVEDNAKREQLLCGISNLPVQTQLEKLKTRIDMIATACETAEKVIADCRKSYGLGTRQGPSLVPTLDKGQAAKIQEQENMLRAAVNFGEGLRISVNERQLPSPIPSHLVDAYYSAEGAQNFGEISGVFQKNTPTLTPNNVHTQTTGAQLLGRSAPSPSPVTKFENVSTPPMPYANSPRSGTNMMNTQSPQQQLHLQHQQQQRQKYLSQQHLLAQQQMRPTGMLGQSSVSQLHDLQGQAQQKANQVTQHQLQYSQPLSQLQNRQMQSALLQPGMVQNQIQQGMAQNQINQGNQLRNHINQFAAAGSSAMFNNSQMITSMPATINSQSLLPSMQFGMTGGLQRNHPSQILNDQMYAMGANPGSMMSMQQQQQQQGVYGNMPAAAQNLQPGMVGIQNPSQNLVGIQNSTQNPNFNQQRQQNQQ